MRRVMAGVICMAVGLIAASSGFSAGKKQAVAPVKKVVSVNGQEKAVVPLKKASGGQTLGKLFMIADFESGATPNNIGGGFGVWNKDPNDQTQGCKMYFIAPGHDDNGQAIKLSYDVDSPNPSYNGFWMKLEDVDLSDYKKVSFWLKGDKDAGYSSKFKLELKNASEVAPLYVEDVSDNWTLIEIPLSNFGRITDWSKMKEFVIVFEDSQATQKTGAICIDDVAFIK